MIIFAVQADHRSKIYEKYQIDENNGEFNPSHI